MLADKLPQPGEAEHLAFGVVKACVPPEKARPRRPCRPLHPPSRNLPSLSQAIGAPFQVRMTQMSHVQTSSSISWALMNSVILVSVLSTQTYRFDDRP
jgi:hypothetical protein